MNLTYEEALVLYPNYMKPYDFEIYDYQSWYAWMDKNWQVSVYLAAAYFLLIVVGRTWMKDSQGFKLQKPLVAWNMFLSFGSLFMFLRMWPEPFEEIKGNGIYHCICNKNNHTVIGSFWCLIFTLSKILEFGDTAFIILRKQPLIFLHWYHHITVAIYTFYTFRSFDPAGRIFGPMNSFIHALMYAYYAARAMGVKVPRSLAQGITSLQILQMVVGLGVNLISAIGKLMWDDCHRPWSNILWALLMYGSYMILFLQFFRKSYFNSKLKSS